MGVVVLLIVFAMGWACDGWRTGLVAMVPIAAGLTLLCFVTTNNPSFTEVERSLSLSLQSIALNFLVKLGSLWLAYSAGRLAQWAAGAVAARRSRGARPA
jgi:hypothetical protein